MSKARFRCAAVTGLVLAAGAAGAAKPALEFSQHGRLLDGADHPVTATLDITVGFHRKQIEADNEYAQNLVWKCVHKQVHVTDGVYGLMIGSGEKPGEPGEPCDPLGPQLFDGVEERWMSVAIGDGPDMQPRLRLGFVPWAVRAQSAMDSDTLGTHPPGYYAARSLLAAEDGTINTASNPVDWSQLKGVPAGLADGVDGDTTYLAGAGLTLNTGSRTFAIDADGVSGAMLAADPASLAKVSGGALTAAGNGNVGIGTASPTARLEVAGQLKVTGGAPGAGNVLTSDATGLASWQPSGLAAPGNAGNLLVSDGAGWTSAALGGDATLAASGALTLGTTGVGAGTYGSVTVDAKGRVTAATNPTTLAGHGITDALQLQASTPGSAQTGHLNLSGTALVGGNVGIGTTTPLARLDVAGPIRIGASAATCNGTIEGTISFNATSKKLELCNGTAWISFSPTPPCTHQYWRLTIDGVQNGGSDVQVTELRFNSGSVALLGTPYEPAATLNGTPMSYMGDNDFANGQQSNFTTGTSFSYNLGASPTRATSASIGQSDSPPRFPNSFRIFWSDNGSSWTQASQITNWAPGNSIAEKVYPFTCP